MHQASPSIRNSLATKLIIAVGLTLLGTISAWAYFSIEFHTETTMKHVVASEVRLSNTIKLGTHYAMMLNSRDDIREIIVNTTRQPEIRNVRIYNKAGVIKFSSNPDEVDKSTNIMSEACYVCHRTTPPKVQVALGERTRIDRSGNGVRLMGVMTPIYNEPGCSTAPCHVHDRDKEVLGLLDVVVSLENADETLLIFQRRTMAIAVFAFLVTSLTILVFVHRMVGRPVAKLIEGTRLIAKGGGFTRVNVDQEDEMGQLADAINDMGRKITDKQVELNKQRDEFQNLFEGVPCIVTVQDRNYRLLRYNRQFGDKFYPDPGDYCFRAYKGRDTKCPNCPVEKTFEDGLSHFSEEEAELADGSSAHWIVTTAPIKDRTGKVVAAMEMCLDISHRRQLEKQLERSEKKYHAIFSNIPNGVFVLDAASLEILECNESARAIYGGRGGGEGLLGRSFLDFSPPEEREKLAAALRSCAMLSQATQTTPDGRRLYVTIRVSPSEYPGRNVLLVTVSDITKRLETEQQLIQASKMATLGEMATGVAHELNQPLSVIQTIGSLFDRKVSRGDPIEPQALADMAEGIVSHVNRATKIINHMREFGRKSDIEREPVQLNDVIEKAFEIFSQQLALRNIEVVWELDADLPMVQGQHNRLEQVFINLLINARDAIEDRWAAGVPGDARKRITLRTRAEGTGRDRRVLAEVCDTGTGIPPELLDRLFEPFFTTKEVGKGTGLGLSISYGIVQDFGGTIHARRNDGGGACLSITLPVAEIPA